MLTIGLLGGMSWESTAEYYRLINQGVRARLGGTHSAKMVLLSVDFAEIEALQHAGDDAGQRAIMVAEARRIKAGGADFLVIATNTMHRFADAVEAEAAIPVLHIADAMGAALAARGFTRIGLLGTRFTMEQPFLKARLAERFGVESLVPHEADRATIHRVIYEELVRGVIRAESREAYRAVIARLADAGAQAIVLACTEIMLLIRPEDSLLPLFDTTALHAAAAVERALG
ncbi:aspartate/glutamate racemase family protein [Novosphingobium sp.]|uniref:aspartate/glutamate racemase family protein n=1 Tax=Novosphingobium sp. TaxID=1874826 RepID=UPI0025EA708F|nr:aspartate/glutamate racemase family protein [Novosphingobium sp.]